MYKIAMTQENPIKIYLDLSGLTYREAAKKTGLSQQAVWLHATGRSGMSGRAAFAYHKAFGLSLEKLLEGGNR